MDDLSSLNLARENLHSLFPDMALFTWFLSILLRDTKPIVKTSSTFKDEYDYVIVGGGTAGSVMANRLSQKPCVRVLLLEAGDNPFILSDVPAAQRLLFESSIDWLYKTVPQKYGAYAQVDNRVIWNSGKTLGGSSVLNAMMYSRGNKKNYDDWEAEGAKGWSYKDVLPYFKKLEDNRNINELDEGYHSIGGPMTMEKPKYTSEIKKPIIKALQSLGFELTDATGKRQIGIDDFQSTTRNGQRCSTAKAYLVPAENRPNLTILKNAFVRKILIEGKRAIGVEFDFEGEMRTVRAKKEVIVSNGAVRTPQLLMLSGIGAKEHLEKFNIPLVKDLPVGKNLQDHCTTTLAYLLNDVTPIVFKYADSLNWMRYITLKSGPFACPNQVSLMAFLNGLNTTANEDFPRHQLYFVEYSTIDVDLHCNLKPEVFDHVYGNFEGEPMYACIVSLLNPKSRGDITLNSTDPYEYPLINPNYYQDESDLQDVVEGMKVCHAVAMSKEMKHLGARPLPTSFPGCEKFIGDDDKYFGCHAKSMINTIWHPTGTARMGDPNDPRSVVDPQLRVIGVDGLRVVNTAVMPTIVSGNPNVPTMMVAERVYDMMKDDIMCENEEPRTS